MKTLLAAALCLAGAALTAPARADDVDDCNSRDSDIALKGCTAFIASGKFSGANLAKGYKNRADAHLKRRAFTQAIADLDTAIGIDPKAVGAYAIRALAHTMSLQYELAIKDYTTVLDLGGADIKRRPKRYADIHHDRARAYERIDRRDLAIADYEKAVGLNRADTHSRAALERLAGTAQKPARKPAPSQAGKGKATLCDRMTANDNDPGRVAEPVAFKDIDASNAVQACLAALASDPGNARLMLNLGRAYNKGEDYKNSFKWTMAAARENYPYAFHGLYLHYLYGEGIKKDRDRQGRYLKLGMEAGVPASVAQLAHRELSQGEGEKDMARARRLIARAKDLGWDTTLLSARLHHSSARQLLARRDPIVIPDWNTEKIVKALRRDELAKYRAELAAARDLYAKYLKGRKKSKYAKTREKIALRIDVIDALAGKAATVQVSALETYYTEVRGKLNGFRFPAHTCNEPQIPSIDASRAVLQKFNTRAKGFGSCLTKSYKKDKQAFLDLVRRLGGTASDDNFRVPGKCKCFGRLQEINRVTGLREDARASGIKALRALMKDYDRFARSRDAGQRKAAYKRHNESVTAAWKKLNKAIPKVSLAVKDIYAAHGLKFSPAVIKFLIYKSR